jgi:hypothetical protein
MISRRKGIPKLVALLITFCLMQVYVFAVPPNSSTPTESSTAAMPQTGGTIKTTNNEPVSVNGNNVKSGTTILSGSTIVTPEGIGATIQFGSVVLDIAPNSEVIVEFTADGNVKVTLKRGCATLKSRGNASGVIITPDGTTTETGQRKRAAVCFPLGATSPIVTQGAGAGAGGATGGGISRTLLALLLLGGGGIAALILAGPGQNPSPSAP